LATWSSGSTLQIHTSRSTSSNKLMTATNTNPSVQQDYDKIQVTLNCY